jgi:hypothetical protein
MTETASREAAARAAGGRLLDAMKLLRFSDFAMPPADADPPTVHAALTDLRARLDQAEPLLEEMTRLRDEAQVRAGRLKAAADDEFDDALTAAAKTAFRREYESGADRQASARVSSSPARKDAREAERVAAILASYDRRVRSAFYGMRDAREELLVRLRSYLPLMTALES